RPAIRALKYATAGCPRIERSRRLGVDGQSRHIGIDGVVGRARGRQAGVDGAPARPAIRALKYATAACPRIERGRRLGVDGQSRLIVTEIVPTVIVGQAGVAGAPARPATRALIYATAVCPRIERGRRLGVDGQSRHRKLEVGGSPARSAIRALKYTSTASRIERGRRLWVDGQSRHKEVRQTGIDGSPAPPTIGALEY